MSKATYLSVNSKERTGSVEVAGDGTIISTVHEVVTRQQMEARLAEIEEQMSSLVHQRRSILEDLSSVREPSPAPALDAGGDGKLKPVALSVESSKS